MSRILGIEDVCNERAVKAAYHIQRFLLLSGAESEQPLLVLYLGTGWKVFGGFEGCERIPLEEIDPEFGCLPKIKDHPNELVYVPNLEETGVAAIVLRGRPHLYQKWFKQVGDDHLVEVSAKYLVRLHTEMIVTLGLVKLGRVGPFIITSATGTLDEEQTPVGAILVPQGYNHLGLDLPIQSFTVARGALCHDLRRKALSCGVEIEVCLDGETKQPLEVRSGGLKVILGPAFEDPQFERLLESYCHVVGMSGPTACHVIRGFNLQMAKDHPEKVVRAVHLCLVTDNPYKKKLIEISPFVLDSPWKPKHEEVVEFSGGIQNAARQFLVNLVRGIRLDHSFD